MNVTHETAYAVMLTQVVAKPSEKPREVTLLPPRDDAGMTTTARPCLTRAKHRARAVLQTKKSSDQL